MKRNTIKVINIDEILDYEPSDTYYKSPFEILAELDHKTRFININDIEQVVLINYKPDGYAIFNFIHGDVIENKVTLNYEFTGFAS